MKAVWKINSTIPALIRETNLMRSLTARLEDDYCSINVANDELIGIIRFRFVAQSYTLLSKSFTNKLYLILHAYYLEVRLTCFDLTGTCSVRHAIMAGQRRWPKKRKGNYWAIRLIWSKSSNFRWRAKIFTASMTYYFLISYLHVV